MKILALLDVNEKWLNEYGSFEEEMKWVEQSGISLRDHIKISEMPHTNLGNLDSIYRALWKGYVIQDIKSRLEYLEIEFTEDQINQAADLYVYEGEYDCNLTYWDNIDNLIENVKQMTKLYNVHVGMRYTTDILVEAKSADEAQDIVARNLDSINIGDMDFDSDDYDVWEEKPQEHSQYYILTKDGTYEKRRKQ